MKDGPQLNFGFNDVDYPFNDGNYEASLRIGLPQLEKLKASNGYLKIPLHSATMRDGTAITEPLTFIDDSKAPAIKSKSVIVASTNDPLWETKLNTQVAILENEELPAFDKTTQATLNLKFEMMQLLISTRDITMYSDSLTRREQLLRELPTAQVSLISR